jgi:hypothetical protein
MRQRCQVAFRTFAATALMPSWLSLIDEMSKKEQGRQRGHYTLEFKLEAVRLDQRGPGLYGHDHCQRVELTVAQ